MVSLPRPRLPMVAARAYVFICTLQLFCCIAAFRLPRSLDKPKKTRTVSEGGILPDP